MGYNPTSASTFPAMHYGFSPWNVIWMFSKMGKKTICGETLVQFYFVWKYLWDTWRLPINPSSHAFSPLLSPFYPFLPSKGSDMPRHLWCSITWIELMYIRAWAGCQSRNNKHASYLSFFYKGKIFGKLNLHRNLHSKLPIYTRLAHFMAWNR